MPNPHQPGPAASHSLPLGSTYSHAPPTPPNSIATQLNPRSGSACVLTRPLRSAYGLTLLPAVEPIAHSHENEKGFTTKEDAEDMNLETT